MVESQLPVVAITINIAIIIVIMDVGRLDQLCSALHWVIGGTNTAHVNVVCMVILNVWTVKWSK